MEQHLARLAAVAQEAGRLREEVAHVDRGAATARIRASFEGVRAAYACMAGMATPAAQAADPDLAVRARDGARRHEALAASVGELAAAQAAARAVVDGERRGKAAAAVVAAVQAALADVAGVAGAGAAAGALKALVEEAGGPAAAAAAVKREVAAGRADWALAPDCTYRPFEALALLEEMATWLRCVFFLRNLPNNNCVAGVASVGGWTAGLNSA